MAMQRDQAESEAMEDNMSNYGDGDDVADGIVSDSDGFETDD